MKTLKNIRHGDMALIGIEKLPTKLKKSKGNVLMVGSHGNNHAFDKGQLYITTNIDKLKEGEFVFGYLVAKGTTLLHPDHGTGKGQIKKTKIPDGIYELRKQVEYTNEGLKPVVD